MLEEQLGRIESKLDELSTDLRQEIRSAKNEVRQELGGRIDGLGHEIISAKNELRHEVNARIDGAVHEISSAKNEISSAKNELRQEFGARIDDLGHQMRLQHEETLANVRDLSLNPYEIRRQFEEADAKLVEQIGRRLDPLETEARTRRKPSD